MARWTKEGQLASSKWTCPRPLTWSCMTSLSLNWENGTGKLTIGWTNNWLDGPSQRLVVNGSMSGGMPVMSGALQRSDLTLVTWHLCSSALWSHYLCHWQSACSAGLLMPLNQIMKFKDGETPPSEMGPCSARPSTRWCASIKAVPDMRTGWE